MTVKQIEVPEFSVVQTDGIYQDRAKKLISLIVQAKEDPMQAVVELLKKADDLRAGSVERRLASLILEIGMDATERTILFPQEKMAEAVGASRSFVSTIINDWKRDGLISSFGRKVKIESVPKLQKIAKG